MSDTTTAPRQRISVEEATALIAGALPVLPAERVPLHAAIGAVLREGVIAERDQPPFDRVTMDGIAIAHAALTAGRREFRVLGTQGAGAAAMALGNPAECVEVMTGSVLPSGADTVVPVERISRRADTAIVEPVYEAAVGQFIHHRASDHRQGQSLLEAGSIIGPPEVAILTIGGRADVAVTRWPRIAVISTGDELVDVGQPIAPFQIRSSNDRAIEAALRKRGFRHVSRARLPDDPRTLAREIGRLHGDNNVLILSGGVSRGKYDHVPAILAGLGVRVIFHKVTQRPGLPLWFGVDGAGKPVFALPGNPVSSLVCLVRYAIPALWRAMGATPRPVPRARLASSVDFAVDLTWFLPVQLDYDEDGIISAIPRPTNTSGDFVALGGTDGFVELPRGQDHFPAGYAAKFFAW
jgi:molybdopterin molybdotransferase